MGVLNEAGSKHGMDAIALLAHEDFRSTGLDRPIHLAVEVKSLKLHMKHLKREGLFLIDSSFDYSSIDESFFRKCINNPIYIYQISSGIGTMQTPQLSRECSLKDVSSDKKLESRVLNSFELSSDSPSLAPTREKHESSLDSIHRSCQNPVHCYDLVELRDFLLCRSHWH